MVRQHKYLMTIRPTRTSPWSHWSGYYRPPASKLTTSEKAGLVTEIDVFRIFDTLRPTAIRDWTEYQPGSLGLGTPISAAPLAQLFNQSPADHGIVPRQWKTAVITPVCPRYQSQHNAVTSGRYQSRQFLLERCHIVIGV